MDPTPSEIVAWKNQYGRIYSIDFGTELYIFRAITYREFVDIESCRETEGFSDLDVEELIVKSTLLFPQDLDFDSPPAGFISGLANEVFHMSGYGSPKLAISILEEKRERSLLRDMKAIIITAMPSYKEEDLDNLNFEHLCEKVVLAEDILKLQNLIALQPDVNITVDISDPEEEVKQEEKKKQQATARRPSGSALPNDPIAAKLRNAL